MRTARRHETTSSRPKSAAIWPFRDNCTTVQASRDKAHEALGSVKEAAMDDLVRTLNELVTCSHFIPAGI